MAKSAKPASISPAPSEAREGVVAGVDDARQTKAGNPMRVLTIGEDRVSFFESEDIARPVAVGDTVTFSLTRKGTFLNGKALVVTRKAGPQPRPPPQPQPQASPPPQPTPAPEVKPKPAPTPALAKGSVGSRPPLHALGEAELEDLYERESREAKIEPARLGQISNQIRYARIEGLLRMILALLQESYLKGPREE
jgi:hypothetical protein